MTKQEFGLKLKLARVAAQLTLKDLSSASGVDIAKISNIENGQGNPTLENILKLTNALNINLI